MNIQSLKELLQKFEHTQEFKFSRDEIQRLVNDYSHTENIEVLARVDRTRSGIASVLTEAGRQAEDETELVDIAHVTRLQSALGDFAIRYRQLQIKHSIELDALSSAKDSKQP
jgi:hypothetical protein